MTPPTGITQALAAPEKLGVHLRRDIALAPYTTMKVGGPADYFATVTSVDQMTGLVRWAQAAALPYFVLGGGSNMLVSDAGIRGLVIHNRCRQVRLEQPPRSDAEAHLFAESGAAMAGVARQSIRDGLTGLLHAETLLRTLKDEWEFAQWNRVPLTIARYKLRSPKRIVSERPTIFEMLALRRAAQRAVELTELLLMSIVPATAGRVGPLKFAVAMHVSHDEGKLVVEQIVSQLKGLMPPHLDFLASLTEVKPEHSLHALLED